MFGLVHYKIRWYFGTRFAATLVLLPNLRARVQVSLARALQHVVYPLWLAVFTVLFLIPVAVVRVYDLGLGIISGLVFGIVVLLGESLWPAQTLWRMVSLFLQQSLRAN